MVAAASTRRATAEERVDVASANRKGGGRVGGSGLGMRGCVMATMVCAAMAKACATLAAAFAATVGACARPSLPRGVGDYGQGLVWDGGSGVHDFIRR